MNNIRIIKNEFGKESFKSKEINNVNPDNQILHPISSQWINTKNLVNPICLTKFQILNNETKIINTYKCKNGTNDYKSLLFLPPIGLTSDDIIKIYDLESIDRLYNWINEHLDVEPSFSSGHVNYFTILRVVNCWIRVNFETLKNYNNFLVKIVSKLFKFNFGDEFNIPEIDKEIRDYVDYWMNKNSGTEFKLNLIEDFYNYLIKKFKLKSN
jgi:hypothetical protein